MNSFTALAYGRVNLIGEHTDYNMGFVLPTTIPQHVEITLSKRSDQTVILHSSANTKDGESRKYSYTLGQEKRSGLWADYLMGATFLLTKAGHKLTGMEVWISSSVPEGSGLSSSAALEISFLKALREAFSLSLTDPELAQIGQKIENEFVGAHVGIMDQMACAIAKSGEALFLDTQDLSYQSVKLPLEALDLLVINSGIKHRHSDGGYNTRRKQCEESCEMLGVKSLRELGKDDLPKLAELPDVLKRRARHVITENARVLAAVKAIQEKNFAELGKLFLESHLSMKNDYEVSVPEIDLLVEELSKLPGVYGARLTGGGFGGSVVAITAKNQAQTIAELILPRYHTLTGQTATVLVAG